MKLTATGEGELSASFFLEYVPKIDYDHGIDQGVTVSRAMHILGNDGYPKGGDLSSVPVGALIEISIRVEASDTGHGRFEVIDHLPGGLEVNPSSTLDDHPDMVPDGTNPNPNPNPNPDWRPWILQLSQEP